MKTFKRLIAVLIAAMMVLGTFTPAMAEATTPSGTITINSPIVGATYKAYKVFDMTMNADGTSFSYTINKSNPFYDKVNEIKGTYGITLTATANDPNTYNVTITGEALKNNIQTFGAALKTAIEAAGRDIAATKTSSAITAKTAASYSFTDLSLGYYLILQDYPEPVGTVTIKDAENNTYGTITATSTDAEKTAIVNAYVAAQTTDAKIQAHITQTGSTNEDGSSIVKDDAGWNKIKQELIASTTADANLKIAQALNQIAGAMADDNSQATKLVFIDSNTPNAVINEKNLIPKWDVPVNPTGEAELHGLPEHGEPEGGKNIVIKEQTNTSPAVYANWTEANIGDEIHYQLSVNATNYERTVVDDPNSVKQIKEYILADYQNENMDFVSSKGIKVTVVKKDKDGNVVGDPLFEQTYDGAWSSKFFKNTSGVAYTDSTQVLTTNDSGLPVSWIEEITEEEAKTRTNVSSTVEDKMIDGQQQYVKGTAPYTLVEGKTGEYVDANGHSVNQEGYLLDANGDKIKDTVTHYFASKYPNDVTIIVDYYMTLMDTAVIDGNGNKNVARFGVNFIEPNDGSYTPVTPSGTPDDRKPSEVKEKDDAVIYTYALALHKVDQDGNDLAGAKFRAKGLTVTKQADGWYKVKKYDATSNNYGDEMLCDSKGLLVIEGLSTSAIMTIEETEAPAGYNKLTETITTNAVDLDKQVTTTSTVTKYDADGKVTSTESEVSTTVTVINTIDELIPVAYAVINNQGTQLPSTGGIGTTLFYVGGAILVLLAGVLLVSKRRAA